MGHAVSNVIHADFGGRPKSFDTDLGLCHFRFELLYHDDRVCLARLTYTFPDEVIVRHITADV